MPEIKHNFTGGKMNKDVDQRLVPKGEYRDAMNIQVSTSEGSDVGTVQNILGNNNIVLGFDTTDFKCVGSYADEKTDSSYWFLRGPESYGKNFPAYNDIIQGSFSKDYIVKLTNDNASIVFTDTKDIVSKAEDHITTGQDAIDASNNIIHLPSTWAGHLSVGDTLKSIIDNNGVFHNFDSKIIHIHEAAFPGDDEYIILDKLTWFGSGSGDFGLLFKSNCLNFQEDSIITGINIVDDVLLWTDGVNEPKKLNIPRSISGTDQDGQTHTYIVNPELPTIQLTEHARPHHVQVLKRKPTKSLNVTLQDNRRPGVVYSTTTFKFSNSTSNLYQPGFTSTITVDSGLAGTVVNYQVGDTIMLLNTLDLVAVNNETLPHQYDVRLIVESINHNIGAGTSQINFEILSISTDTPVQEEDYTALLSESGSDDFKNSMFRFSYRYKFLDGETSAFAPFTPVVFIPGEFKYNKTNAYNEGMVNNVSEVVLNDFIDFPNTLDVSSIDLLVKYENSPNVYIIDTVKRGKFSQTIPDAFGNPFGGTYTFNPKQIKATLPENQLLRAWDNVPKRALTQEITGNRLVYGNYAQSYDYNSEDLNILPSVKNRNVELTRETDGAPSIKTQRSYQVGVVLVDSEGRESPIITNETSSVTVGKLMANTNTTLSVVNNSSLPGWVNSYKYYVKDHMQPFYSIVLDSFYKAKNGDFWISVPSSERNKVQEGDLLELKKGINSNVAVLEKSETKVIAIENEAPDFIKTSYRSLGKAKQEDIVGGTTNKLIEAGGLAAVGKDWFWVHENNWLTQNSEGFGGGGKLTGFDEMAIRFEASPALNTAVGGVYKSKLYECSTITSGLSIGGGDAVFIVRLKERISEADDWIIDPGDPNGENIEPTLKLEVFERVIASSADYHGKFFAKIEAKEDLLQNMAVLDINDSWQQQQHVQMIHNFCDEGADRNTNTSISGVALTESDYDLNSYAQYPPSNGGLNSNSNQIATTGATDNYLHWENIFEYFNVGAYNVLPQYWFVDRMYYRGLQNKNSSTPDMYQDGSNMGRGIFQATAADVALNLYGGNFVQDGGFYMEVSLVGMFPTISHDNVGNVNSVDFGWDSRWTATSGSFFSDPAGQILSGHQPAFNATAQADALHHLTLAGQRWKWEDSDVVFTIINTHTNFRYNYAGGDEALAEDYDEVAASQATPPTQYWDYARRQFSHPLNRRLTIILELDKDPRIWGVDITDSATYGTQPNSVAIGANMVFLETGFEAVEGEALTTNNPAVFEVKKTDEDNLDIYYEASDEIPIDLTYPSLSRLIPVGSKVTYPGDDTLLNNSVVTSITEGFPSKININNAVGGVSGYNAWQGAVINGDKLTFVTPFGNNINIALQEVNNGQTSSPILTPVNSTLGGSFSVSLNWFNCISFRNGVESFYLKDDYNEKFITKGVKASSTLDKDYEETHKKSGLIYSGLFNSTSDVNNLNQFIAAEKITKDINPIYGSIQKLYSGWGQGGDLIALCEDRVLKILANKDALYNADGNTNVTSTNNVLGQAIPYSGEYGISKNPESFASEAYRIYFTDKVRGTVMRLSMDGLTPISNHGMKDWFRDHLKLGDKLIGSYDDKKDEYNITIKGDTIAKTVTFKEDVKGWVSFKSFTPENAISCANEYYTFKNGDIWKHHSEAVDRNTFYNESLVPSSVEVIFNEVPGSVKSFKTVNYEGSQAKVTSKDEDGVTLMDGEYFNLSDIDGWHVTNVITNLERGGITEFIKKEGKWFGYVIGDDITVNSTGNVSGNYDTEDFSIQGVGRTANVVSSIIFGCTDATMFNYSDAVTNDDGSCINFSHGCMDPSADNFQSSANTDDGSCYYLGCTAGPLADQEQFGGSINYDPNATVDDGSCIPAVWGCTVLGYFNSNPLANMPSNYCIPFNPGCTDIEASNYIQLVDEMTDVNVDDGSCEYKGCTDPLATNYDLMFVGSTVDGPNGMLTYLNGTAIDDGSCTYIGGCMDAAACNYDPAAVIDNGSCSYCGDPDAENFTVPNDLGCVTNCEYCAPISNIQILSQTTSDVVGAVDQMNGTAVISFSEPANAYGVMIIVGNWYIDQANSITPSTGWGSGTITFTATGLGVGTLNLSTSVTCPTSNTTNAWATNVGIVNPPLIITTTVTPVIGCIDDGFTYTGGVVNPAGGTWGACNYDNTANADASGVVGGTDYSNCNYTDCVGCDDQLYVEYCGDCWDPLSFVNGPPGSGYSQWVSDTVPTSCTTLIVSGCTDATAFNYDPLANTDDGSCAPFIYGCTDGTLNNDGTPAASNYNVNANTDDGSCNPYNCPTISIVQSSTTTSFRINTYNTTYPNTNTYWSGSGTNATVDGNNVTLVPWTSLTANGGTVIGVKKNKLTAGYLTTGSTTVDIVFNVMTADGYCSITETQTFTAGCTDANADSFGSFDITDNTQCDYTGCTDPTACNYEAYYTVADNASCLYCGDPAAYNYDGADGACTSECLYVGCMDATLQADGSGYAASNYAGPGSGASPEASIPCNDTDPNQNGGTGTFDANENNGCCTYNTTPGIEFGDPFLPLADVFRVYYDTGDTGYTEGEMPTLVIGNASGAQATISGQTQNNMTFSSSTRIAHHMVPGSAGASNGQSSEWWNYVYNGQLDVSVTNATFNGACDNPSINNQLPTGYASDSRSYSVGCRNDSTAANYNANLDLHLASSCVAANPGCMDPNAENYDAAFNQDCSGTNSGSDYGCCCYTCSAPTWQNPAVSNISWDAATSPTFATQFNLNWNAVSTASTYTLTHNGSGSFTSLTVTPTITNGIATYILFNNSPTRFQHGTTYTFKLEANCVSANGDSCGVSSEEITSHEFDCGC